MKVLVTGATGFVGRALITLLRENYISVTAMIRGGQNNFYEQGEVLCVEDLTKIIEDETSKKEELIEVLQICNVVVHCAARVHIMNDVVSDPLTAFRKVNTEATIALALLAAESGVKRFIFLSSIKVNGENTEERVFTDNNVVIPSDSYGLSKYEAEQGLFVIAKETGMEVVIIRPPLVYGPGVRANFASMMKWVQKDVPLPFGAVHNQRSLVALDNLVSFIIHCIDHPKAANEIFLISDGEDVSTTELLQKVAKAFGKKSRLIPIPVKLMKLAARLVGKGDVANRLFGSLQVDSSKARDLLGWKPVVTMDEQLKKIVQAKK